MFLISAELLSYLYLCVIFIRDGNISLYMSVYTFPYKSGLLCEFILYPVHLKC